MKYIVAPRNSHLYLLNQLRESDPFLDIKLTSKEELSRAVFPSFSEASLIYLMKEKGYSYEISKMYLSDLKYILCDSTDFKIHFLFELKKELIENGFEIPVLENDFLNKEVEVYGYSKRDFELENIFNNLNIKANYHLNNSKEAPFELVNYKKIEDEVYSVLNEIASIIDGGTNINDIYIFRRSNSYDYYLKKFSRFFGYELNIKNSESIYLTGGTKRFLELYDESKDLSISLTKLKEEMKDDPLYLDIEDLVNNSILEDCSFEIQKDYLVNKFKEKSIPSIKYKNAVKVIDSPIITTDKHFFVMGFAQGSYPRSSKDDKYLNIKQLSSINRLNPKDRTKIDEDDLINFFNSNNEFRFSFAKNSKEGEAYLSPITKKIAFNFVNEKLDDYFYSEEVLKLIYSGLRDLDYFYKERGEKFFKVRDVVSLDYDSYSNKYEYRAKAYDENSFISLSTTSLDLYSNCHFHYYLDRVLKLDEQEGTYALSLGIIAHHIFEHCRDENFDFDKEFEAKMSEYQFKSSEKYVLTHNIKAQLLEAVKAIKLREKYYTNPVISNEVKFKHFLTKNTVINGTIDNFVTIDDKYFICIDYKTGSTKFDENKLQYGLSTQLPTYALLTLSNEKYKDLELAGLYINNVLTSSLFVKKEDDELIPGYLKLNGKTIGDLNAVAKIDSTVIDGKSSFISGVALKSDGSGLKEVKSIVSPFAFDEYVQKVKDLYIDMDAKLRNNEFDIKPIFFSSRDNACMYCPYRDVCFVRREQFDDKSGGEDEDE